MHSCNQGGRDCLCGSCPHPAANSQGQYAGPGNGGYQRGGKRLPILPGHLQGSIAGLPLEAHGVLMYPLQLLMGNMSLATLLAIPPGVHCHGGTYPIQLLQQHLHPQESNGDVIHLTRCHPHHSLETKLWEPLKSHPTRNGKMGYLLRNS